MKGITMSGALPLQVLSGAKTQTRRVAVAAQVAALSFVVDCGDGFFGDEEGTVRFECPYGKPGDRLYVRETHYRYGHWEPVPGVKTKGGRQKWAFVADSDEVRFDAPVSKVSRWIGSERVPCWYKRLARFMPKACARTFLEVVAVRVERLQEISEKDAMAEGCISGCASYDIDYETVKAAINQRGLYAAVARFSLLWESINGPGSWAANPWVWVVEFRKVAP